VGRGGLLEGQHRADRCAESRRHPTGEVGGGRGLLLPRGLEHHEAHEPRLLDVERSDRKRGPRLAARHEHDPSPLREHRHHRVEIGLAECLPHHVHAPGRCGEHGLDDRFAGWRERATVDHRVRSQRGDARRGVGARGGGDDPRAEPLGDLHDHRADAPRTATHEDRLAGPQAGVGDETEVRGDPHEGRGRRVAIGHVRRGRVEPAGVDGCELGARALPTEQALVRSPDAIADGEPRDGLAHRHDIACQIASHHERQGQRHRHGTAADVGVDRVHRRRTHPHEHVVGTRSRVGPITHADDVRRAGSFDECRTHPSPFS
jgi:hypothetical protein